MKKFYSFLGLALFATFCASAQIQIFPGKGGPGNATQSGSVYTLTRSDVYYGGQSNAIWEMTQVNLASPFKLCAKLNFGVFSETNIDQNNPNVMTAAGNSTGTGADGIVFVLAPQPYVGVSGEEIGYGTFGIDDGTFTENHNYSFGVEFDTWSNSGGDLQNGRRDLGDPIQDHMAFMRRGETDHNHVFNSTYAPVSLGEIEDGMWHDVEITWDPVTGMSVSFDGGAPILAPAAYVLAGLNGATMVNWGFTSATGLATNVHQVELVQCETPPPPPGDCGQLRTQTMGGWGQKPSGNNPGSYLAANFDAAFPAGVMIGTAAGNSATWTSATAVRNYLPAGGPSKALTTDYTNPTTNQLKNNAAGQLLTLSLSVGFDNYDADFGDAGIRLGDMIISSGAFAGWSVDDFLAEANIVISGGASSFTISQVQSTATAINENYVDGNTDNGYLDCPVTTAPAKFSPSLISEPVEVSAPSAMLYPNPSRGSVQVKLDKNISDRTEIQVINTRGVMVERRIVNGNAPVMNFDLKKYGTGIFLVKIINGTQVETKKVLVRE